MIKIDLIQHLSKVSLVMSNTFKFKQTVSYSLKNIKYLFQCVSVCLADYKTYRALSMATLATPTVKLILASSKYNLHFMPKSRLFSAKATVLLNEQPALSFETLFLEC